jgi:chromosome segregation ATPase
MRNNDYIAAMYICDVENLIERLLNTIEEWYEFSLGSDQREKIKKLCKRDIDAHVIGVPTEREEIDRLKAELARYMELGTPDEFAKALASSKDGAYPNLLDKYLKLRRTAEEKQGEIIKLRGVIDGLNRKAEELTHELEHGQREVLVKVPKETPNDEDAVKLVMDENNRLGNQLCSANCKIRDLERTVENRNRTCEKRKERIAQLKAQNRRLENLLLEYAKELGKYEGDKQG